MPSIYSKARKAGMAFQKGVKKFNKGRERFGREVEKFRGGMRKSGFGGGSMGTDFQVPDIGGFQGSKRKRRSDPYSMSL